MTTFKNVVLLVVVLIAIGLGSITTYDRKDIDVGEFEVVSNESNKVSTDENELVDDTLKEGDKQNSENYEKFLEEDFFKIPDYEGKPYVVINDNEPFFTDAEITSISYEKYSELDELERCGIATASIGKDLMPTEDRESIGSVKPTGWHTAKYDNVDGKYLYNRCHLIGFQLTGENANERNLITGTRYMNVQGMLPFENMVADYVKETNNHVMYRVTPIFEGDNLLASGVLMEACSVEDKGDGISFNVYCYNVQPGIEIYYETGESFEAFHDFESTNNTTTENTQTYILNTNTKKFHYDTCSSVTSMNEKNKDTYRGTRADLVLQGYAPCGSCKP